MRILSCISCIIMIILLSGIGGAAEIATVHGVAYDWSTFDPLDNAIVEVDSTPSQSMVAKYGVYSFELTNGTYNITASYYEGDRLTYYAEDTIIVSEEGSYVLDLLLLPSYSSSSEGSKDQSTTSDTTGNNSILIGAVVVAVLLMGVLTLQIMKKPKSSAPKKVKLEASTYVVPENNEKPVVELEEEPELEVPEGRADTTVDKTVAEPVNIPPLEDKKHDVPILSDEPVPADLQEILDILKSQGGRMTQKDMRKRLKYSEGKVSLMLLDLEKRGKIQKFKKGRGNVLFLVDQEE